MSSPTTLLQIEIISTIKLQQNLCGQTNLDANVRISKTPTHVGKIAVVSAWRSNEIRVLSRSSFVPRTENRGSKAIAVWQGIELVANGVDGTIVLVLVAGSVGRRATAVLCRKTLAIEEALARTVLNRNGEGRSDEAQDSSREEQREMHDGGGKRIRRGSQEEGAAGDLVFIARKVNWSRWLLYSTLCSQDAKILGPELGRFRSSKLGGVSD